jgi:hypothetical protein
VVTLNLRASCTSDVASSLKQSLYFIVKRLFTVVLHVCISCKLVLKVILLVSGRPCRFSTAFLMNIGVMALVLWCKARTGNRR